MPFNFTWLQMRTVVDTDKKKQKKTTRPQSVFRKAWQHMVMQGRTNCAYGNISKQRQNKRNPIVIGRPAEIDNISEMLSVKIEKYHISRYLWFY